MIKNYKEFNNEQHSVSSRKYNELVKEVYELSYQMQQEIMGNQCFIVLGNADAENTNQYYRIENEFSEDEMDTSDSEESSD